MESRDLDGDLKGYNHGVCGGTSGVWGVKSWEMGREIKTSWARVRGA